MGAPDILKAIPTCDQIRERLAELGRETKTLHVLLRAAERAQRVKGEQAGEADREHD